MSLAKETLSSRRVRAAKLSMSVREASSWETALRKKSCCRSLRGLAVRRRWLNSALSSSFLLESRSPSHAAIAASVSLAAIASAKAS